MTAAFFVGLGFGLFSGVVATIALRAKVQSVIASALTKVAAKVGPKG